MKIARSKRRELPKCQNGPVGIHRWPYDEPLVVEKDFVEAYELDLNQALALAYKYDMNGSTVKAVTENSN